MKMKEFVLSETKLFIGYIIEGRGSEPPLDPPLKCAPKHLLSTEQYLFMYWTLNAHITQLSSDLVKCRMDFPILKSRTSPFPILGVSGVFSPSYLFSKF